MEDCARSGIKVKVETGRGGDESSALMSLNS